MTAEPPESPVTEAVRSLEVRWIFPGQLEAAVARWFARFPAAVESREDTYLMDPPLRGLSVKVRGGGALEVKVYRGGPGILEVAGRARGRMETWHKWSFPFSPLSPGVGDPPGWRPVHKKRRISRFSLASGQIAGRGARPTEQPGCEVELAEVRTGGQDWWTLGFEATGGAEVGRRPAVVRAAVPDAGPAHHQQVMNDPASRWEYARSSRAPWCPGRTCGDAAPGHWSDRT